MKRRNVKRLLERLSKTYGDLIVNKIETAEFNDSTVYIFDDHIELIEKGAMFTRFIEERAYQKFKALLIHTAGQPPRSTRHIVTRLNKELGLPIYVFCDADPWGMAIAITIISSPPSWPTMWRGMQKD